MRRAAGVLAVAVAVTLLATWWTFLAGWAEHAFGFGRGDSNDPHYLFISGVGPVIIAPLFNLAGLAVLFWWHNQCSVHGCYWYARRRTDAGDRACWRHFPAERMTVRALQERHRLYIGQRPGRG